MSFKVNTKTLGLYNTDRPGEEYIIVLAPYFWLRCDDDCKYVMYFCSAHEEKRRTKDSISNIKQLGWNPFLV
jgi:hypothetical protein